jgi:hypothetical protein
MATLINGSRATQVYEFGVENTTTGIVYPFSDYSEAKQYAEAATQRQLKCRAVYLTDWFDAK